MDHNQPPAPAPKRRLQTVAYIAAVAALLATIAGPAPSLRASSTPSPALNLLTSNQASFESGTAGWQPSTASTISSTRTTAYDGSRSMYVKTRSRLGRKPVTVSASTPGGTRGVRTQAGATYDGSIRVRSSITERAPHDATFVGSRLMVPC